MSTLSPQQQLKKDIECIDNKIKGKIFARAPHNHRQYNVFLNKNPIASVEIPNSMYHDWDKKISLQAKLHPGQKLLSYTDLLNFSLARTGMFLSVKNSIENRLKKESNKIKSKYTTLKGVKKQCFKQASHHYLLLENELHFHSQASPSIEVTGEI